MKRVSRYSLTVTRLLLLGITLCLAAHRAGSAERPAMSVPVKSPESQTQASIADSEHTQLPQLLTEPVELLAQERGLRLERQRWHLGDRSGWAWRARLPLDAQVRVQAAERVVDFEELIPDDPGPWVAVNGGFYGLDGSAMGLVIADGKVRSRFRRGGGSGVFEVRDEVPRIVHHSAYRPGAQQAIQSIDRIVGNGRSLVRRRSDARAAARAAVGIGSAELIVVVIAQNVGTLGDGNDVTLHFAAHNGLPLWVFADYLLSTTDIRDALNLDGSVSAQMRAKVGGVDLRVKGLRGTANAIVMRPR